MERVKKEKGVRRKKEEGRRRRKKEEGRKKKKDERKEKKEERRKKKLRRGAGRRWEAVMATFPSTVANHAKRCSCLRPNNTATRACNSEKEKGK